MTYTVLVTGDRNWDIDNDTHVDAITNELKTLVAYTVDDEGIRIVHGAARGVDTIAEAAALVLGYDIAPYPAEWDKYHKAAGPKRNQQMLDEEHPNLVIAFHDDIKTSKGTKDMVKRALKANVQVIHVQSDGKAWASVNGSLATL